jgi:hypothetical protein
MERSSTLEILKLLFEGSYCIEAIYRAIMLLLVAPDALIDGVNVDLKLDTSVTCICFAWVQGGMAIGTANAEVFFKPDVNGVPRNWFQVIFFAELCKPELQDVFFRDLRSRVLAHFDISK